MIEDPEASELLVVRCQLGERAAFDELIAQWGVPLRRHLGRVSEDEPMADDLTQEVWLKVVRGIGQLRDAGRFRPWLFGIAHRVLMDRLRLRYAAPQAGPDPDDLADHRADPASDLDAARRDIDAGLSRLPAAERELLTLFHLDGLSLAELVEVFDVPAGTIKSRLFRARTLLRKALTQQVFLRNDINGVQP